MNDDPTMNQIKRIKSIADDINRSINPIFDHEKFLNDVRICKAIAESKVKSRESQLQAFEAAKIFTCDDEHEMDVIIQEISAFEKEVEVLTWVINVIENGKYYLE